MTQSGHEWPLLLRCTAVTLAAYLTLIKISVDALGYGCVGVGDGPQTYKDLVELAKICIVQARQGKTKEEAQKFHRMAKEYQRRAAALNGGRMPDIGEKDQE
jgi:hypothetical protein